MPERRARMLSVEEAPVVSVPLVAVPVEAPTNWLDEPAPAAPKGPARFKSEDEDEASDKADAAFFFASSTPAVATTVTVAGPAPDKKTEFEREQADKAVPAGSKAGSSPQPRDYTGDFSENLGMPAIQVEQGTQPVASLFVEGEEEQTRDLDVPAFMRRMKF
jgi:hypothetical protein